MTNEDLLKKVSESLNLKSGEELEEERLAAEAAELEANGTDADDDDDDDNLDNPAEIEIEEEDEEDDDEEDDEAPSIDGINSNAFDNPTRTKEEKNNFAFAKLRKENKETKEELARVQALAEAYGFSDYKAMLEQLDKEAMAKKARDEGLDPKVYKRIYETERQLEEIKRQREEEISNSRVLQVNSRLDGFIEKNSLKEADKTKLIMALDEDGYRIEDLVRLKNPEMLFKTYLQSEISEIKNQKEIEKAEKRKKLEETKYQGEGHQPQYSIKDLIKNMVKNNSNL